MMVPHTRWKKPRPGRRTLRGLFVEDPSIFVSNAGRRFTNNLAPSGVSPGNSPFSVKTWTPRTPRVKATVKNTRVSPKPHCLSAVDDPPKFTEAEAERFFGRRSLGPVSRQLPVRQDALRRKTTVAGLLVNKGLTLRRTQLPLVKPMCFGREWCQKKGAEIATAAVEGVCACTASPTAQRCFEKGENQRILI